MNRTSILVFCLIALAVIACKRDDASFKQKVIELPVNAKVRCLVPFGDSVLIAGGDRDAQGFVMVSDDQFSTFSMRKDNFKAAVYSAIQFNSKWVIGLDSSWLYFSDNLRKFQFHWWNREDWVSTLSKRPLWSMSQAGGNLFIAGGGNLAFGVAYHSADTLNRWNPYETEHEFRSITAIGDASSWSAWAGGNGILIKKTSENSEWKTIDLPSTFAADFVFDSEEVGWMVTYRGEVLKTKDGGETWASVHKQKKERTVNRMIRKGSDWIIAGNSGDFAFSNNGKDWRWFSFDSDLDLTDAIIIGDHCFFSADDQNIHRVDLSSLKE